MNSSTHIFKIEDRRRQVASLVAQSMSQEEIASKLDVDRTTISRDITALKEMSQQFIFDLAKSDLAYCYKSCIDGIEETKRQAWEMFRSEEKEKKLTPKDKLLALKLIKECNEGMFSLFKDGPSVLNVKMLEQRVSQVINKQ